MILMNKTNKTNTFCPFAEMYANPTSPEELEATTLRHAASEKAKIAAWDAVPEIEKVRARARALARAFEAVRA